METGEGNQLEPANLSSFLMVKVYTAKQLVSFHSFRRSELYMTPRIAIEALQLLDILSPSNQRGKWLNSLSTLGDPRFFGLSVSIWDCPSWYKNICVWGREVILYLNTGIYCLGNEKKPTKIIIKINPVSSSPHCSDCSAEHSGSGSCCSWLPALSVQWSLAFFVWLEVPHGWSHWTQSHASVMLRVQLSLTSHFSPPVQNMKLRGCLWGFVWSSLTVSRLGTHLGSFRIEYKEGCRISATVIFL